MITKTLFILFCLKTALAIAQNSWVTVGEMPRAVYGGQAIVIDSAIYIVGGFDEQLPNNSSSKFSDSIRVYYPLSGSWENSIKMIEPRYGLIADKYKDSLIYLGGVKSDNIYSNTIEIWNNNSAPYVYKTNPDCDRNFGTGIILEDYFYLFGGNNTLINFNYMSKINIKTGNTDQKSNFNFIVFPPTNQNAATDGTNIYLFGGIQGDLLSKNIFKFSIISDSLTLINLRLNNPRSFGSVIYLENNQYYIIGGINETQVLNSVEIFDSGKMEISSGPSLNNSRRELMAVKYNNSIFVFGGIDSNGQPVKEIEKLDITTGIKERIDTIVEDFQLFNNYPNPFNPSTIIKYSVPKESFVTLRIYNLLGEEITTLVSGEKSPGVYKVRFDANINSNSLQSGVYFYRLQTENFIQTKKMIFLR